MKVLIILLMFFIVGGLLIVSNNDLALSNPSHLEEFYGFYLTWVDGLYGNAQSITGNVVRLDWTPFE